MPLCLSLSFHKSYVNISFNFLPPSELCPPLKHNPCGFSQYSRLGSVNCCVMGRVHKAWHWPKYGGLWQRAEWVVSSSAHPPSFVLTLANPVACPPTLLCSQSVGAVNGSPVLVCLNAQWAPEQRRHIALLGIAKGWYCTRLHFPDNKQLVMGRGRMVIWNVLHTRNYHGVSWGSGNKNSFRTEMLEGGVLMLRGDLLWNGCTPCWRRKMLPKCPCCSRFSS